MGVLRQGEVVHSETARYEVLHKIGEGQFSEVYHVVEHNTTTKTQVGPRRHDVR